MRIDPKLVRELAQLLTDNELTEIEVRTASGGSGSAASPRRVRRRARRRFSRRAGARAPPVHAKEDIGATRQEDVGGNTVKSPMVGTAFLSPEPGAKPFIEVGDTVKAGDTLLIVEAMKVMNPITAPEGGVGQEDLIADGQPVEFDQPLVIIG